jgi:NhaP-type Na+/H+ or K+/H+ antiporter
MADTILAYEILVTFTLLLIYVVVGGCIEKRKCLFGHEAGLAIVLGLAVSGIVKLANPEVAESFKFNDNIFFYFFLPPIIFAAGFNMRRKKFFSHIGYILLFGVLGTIINFIVFAVITSLVAKTGFLEKYSWTTR